MGLKKAFFFSVDAFFASIILMTSILIFSNLYIEETDTLHLSSISNDMLAILSELKVSEVNNSYLNALILQGEVDDLNATLIEQIGTFWALNKTDMASNLTQNLTYSLFPGNLGYSIAIGDEEIYKRDFFGRGMVASRRMISGFEKSKPIKGSTSRAYLKSIKQKTTSSYAYFGGFVGQGDITRYLEIPSPDANIFAITVEMDAGTQFELYVNDTLCDTLMPSPANMSSTRWNITDCKNLFGPGSNKLFVHFLGLFNESYIGGGYVRVDYTTKQLNVEKEEGLAYYYFPGIDGVINLYSSFDIPGTLNSIDLYVRFYNNKTTYLNIGNETIFSTSGSVSDQEVNISGITLPIQPQTIPLRLGVSNISGSFNITSGEPSDSILVTDVSGSMNECGEYTVQEMCRYECCGWWIGGMGWCLWWYDIQCPYGGTCAGDQCGSCASGQTRNNEVLNDSTCLNTKMDLAKEADLQFVDTILNASGNKVGLVSYQSSVSSFENYTDVKLDLQTEINGYSAGGGTCICCGINRARNLLASSEKKQFMVVMSDGEATLYCDDYDDYTGSGSGGSDPIDRQWAIDAGQYACNTTNITVFAVGFGLDADHDTLKQVACNESFYYNASNASQISDIYKIIGDEILVIANFTSQIITLSGGSMESTLYPDSYILFNYTPMVQPSTFGEIELVRETDKFNSCNPNMMLPNNTRITEAKALSYSGQHWTSLLKVNNITIFNITNFGSVYRDIGDPFVVQIPPTNLQSGLNNLEFATADNPNNQTGCSMNNSVVYTLAVKSAISYSEVLPNAEGCTWQIETEESNIIVASVPSGYSGTKICKYRSNNITYDPSDSIDDAVYDLLVNLDFDGNGKIDIDIEAQDMEIEALWVSQVPYLWGPAIVEVRVWQ